MDAHGSKGGFRPSTRPATPELLKLWTDAALPQYARGMRALRRLKRGRRSLAFASACEAYSVLRPRRWLQRAMVPHLAKLWAAVGRGPLVGVHLRSGFADWQWYSSTRRPAAAATGRKDQANTPWAAALAAPPMAYAQHWHVFEAMLHDCTEPVGPGGRPDGAPCFNWRTPRFGRSPSVHAANVVCATATIAARRATRHKRYAALHDAHSCPLYAS